MELLARMCPEVQVASEMTQTFAAMVKERRVEDFSGWLEKARECSVSESRAFAKGLVQDEAAVRPL